jgi:hypothetical protein
MFEFVEKNAPQILREIHSQKVISPELEQNINQVLKDFAGEFRNSMDSQG